jgi:aurora kinase
MANRGLESRFARMSVNDENDPGDGSKPYLKSKVRDIIVYDDSQLTIS